jgi:hypothetical protein
MTQDVWDEMIADPAHPFGHSYVIGALLTGNIQLDESSSSARSAGAKRRRRFSRW